MASACAILVGATVATPAVAQEPADAVMLDELSVTQTGIGRPPTSGTIGQPSPLYAGGQVAAQGRVGLLGNRSIFETPFTQNNYAAELARDQGARTVADVLANDPAVRTAQPPFGSQDIVFVRGVVLNSRDFAFDGLYGISDARKPIIEGIERFEVQHGPAAFLYGFPPNGSVAGVVNLIPKRAGDVPVTRVTTTYMSRASGSTQVDVGRRFGEGNALGVRLNAFYSDGQTPIDQQAIRNGGATLGLDYRGEAFRFSLDAGYHNLAYRSPTGAFSILPGIAVPRAPDLTINQQPRWAFTDSESGFAVARAEYDVAPDWTLFAAFGGSRTSEFFTYPTFTITNARGDLNGRTILFPDRQSQLTAEAGIRGSFDTGTVHHAVAIVGTAYSNDNPYASGLGPSVVSNLYRPLASLPPNFARIPRIVAQQPAELKGLAAVDTVSVVPHVIDLIVGVRGQSVENRNYDPVTAALASTYAKSAVTPLAGMVVKPVPWMSLYASYAEGLSLGPTAPSDARNAGAVFPPTVSTQLETGAKFDLGELGLTLAFYDIALPSPFLDPVTRIYGLTGEQHNKGIDFNVFGSPVDGIRLLGGITLLDGRLVKTAGGAFDGKVAPGVPAVQLNLTAEVDLPRHLLPGASLAGRVLYTAAQYYDQVSTQKIPDWTRFDLGIRYRFTINDTPLIASFNVENVAARDYYASTGAGKLILGMPRTFKLSLTADL
ncbi:iron complex outermembrane receptor protein [Methylobacterium brachiatum]|uniref:Iron complex outermembrane receptor protein n=2 Tax=Methylobacterium brachiatum TaxID=269660 RepID=A0AAJ1TQP5_9HYPH|nr:TonB-dependent receptor [Methylobacterium brachiatum]MCB4800851.1 TonB-dependent receptor [Methylobacterium brachiatum]MDQ0541382.1 iron complex outermembrane receptor protein [Methylobacterium brachiatum]